MTEGSNCSDRESVLALSWHSDGESEPSRRRLASSEHGTTGGLLLLTEDESSGSLEDAEASALGLSALELKGDLLGLLGLLSEDGLGLTTETLLLHVVSALTESSRGIFTLLVLGDLVHGVLLGLHAEAFESLRNVDHYLLATCLN
jgi:hypothetical protein